MPSLAILYLLSNEKSLASVRPRSRTNVKNDGSHEESLWFAKTLADFEINNIAAFPPLFFYDS